MSVQCSMTNPHKNVTAIFFFLQRPSTTKLKGDYGPDWFKTFQYTEKKYFLNCGYHQYLLFDIIVSYGIHCMVTDQHRKNFEVPYLHK
jgi:hypothetical protein